MCFSPEASFGLAAVLTVVGALSVSSAKTPQGKLFGLAPFFFAIQQYAEGFLWLHIPCCEEFSENAEPLQYLFLFIALIVYPLFFPLSAFLLERKRSRRRAILLFLIAGILVTLRNISDLLYYHPEAAIINQSIKYFPFEYVWYAKLLYLVIITTPLLLSSLKGMWIVGGLTLIGFIVSLTLYTWTFTSVWCFFAALFSICVYYIIRKNHL
ncbi:MAG: hypothetical protein Tsb0021_12280 [Chlamydiales bacterium]